MDITFLNTENWFGLVLMVLFLVIGATIVAHLMALLASGLLAVVMSQAGDRDEELMAQGDEQAA